MEYLDGVSVRDAEPVLAESGADRHGLARGLLGTILRQVIAEGRAWAAAAAQKSAGGICRSPASPPATG
jgi:hypothetical protein